MPDDIDASPYRARLAAAYCAHFGITAHSPAQLPDGFGGVSVDGAIDGMTDAQRARLGAALDRRLRQTPWFDAAARDNVVVAVAGHQRASYAAREVERSAAWSEMQTYTEQESYQEPYQESYQESYQQPYQESYTEQVPYTEFRTESYSCGFGSAYSTCTRSVSSISYRSETRFRTAYHTAYRTAHHTAFRTAQRTVTRARYVPRTFNYTATERTGDYSGSWRLAVGLGDGAPPVALEVAKTHHAIGDDHDVSFALARVEPSRARLPSADDWFAELLGALSTALPSQLARTWTARFCGPPSFDAETAARCAYGGASAGGAPAAVPVGAQAELARLFGKDVDQVIARSPPRRRAELGRRGARWRLQPRTMAA